MFAHAPHPGGQQQAGQSCAGDDQHGQQRCPWQFQAEQQAEQYAVVAVETGLAVGTVVAAALRGEQPGKGAQQRTADRRDEALDGRGRAGDMAGQSQRKRDHPLLERTSQSEVSHFDLAVMADQDIRQALAQETDPVQIHQILTQTPDLNADDPDADSSRTGQ